MIKLKEDTRNEIIRWLRKWKGNEEASDYFLYDLRKGLELILRVLLEKEGL